MQQTTLVLWRSHFPMVNWLRGCVIVTDFAFEAGNRTHTCISKNNVVYCRKKSKENMGFSKSTLKTSLKHRWRFTT